MASASCLSTNYEVELADADHGLDNLKHCRKNAGHKNMYPITELSIDHLPMNWRKPGLFAQILHIGQHTVKVRVSFVSPNRPDRYCNPMYRGKHVTYVGKGMTFPSDDSLSQPAIDCPLKNCSVMSGAHKVTALFHVYTANHVVFDDMEAEHTSLEFFYDSPDRSSVIQGQVVGVIKSYMQGDTCALGCVSHDLSLMEKLWAFPTPPANYVVPPPSPYSPCDPLVIVVGHPHGCYKHVSFGEWVGYETLPVYDEDNKIRPIEFLALVEALEPNWRINGWKNEAEGIYLSPHRLLEWEALAQENPNLTMAEASKEHNAFPLASITYTADTCPGSSGAWVFVFFQDWADAGPAVGTAHFRHRKGKGNASGRASIRNTKWQENVKIFLKKIPAY